MLWGVCKVSVMNAPLVDSVLLNSPVIIIYYYAWEWYVMALPHF